MSAININDYLIQLNSESNRFIAGIDAATRENRITAVLDAIRFEMRDSETGIGSDIFTKKKEHFCTVINTGVFFPNQKMLDLFTRTLFQTK